MAKTLAQIATEITNKILTGGRRTTATNTRSVLTDIAESSLNVKDGGMVIESKVGYSTPITPTEDYEFATKKYVLDNGGSVPDATTTVKGKSELIEDAELDSATPSDNSATTPTESAITLGIRQLHRLWKKIFTVFYTKLETDAKYQTKLLTRGNLSFSSGTINWTASSGGDGLEKDILYFNPSVPATVTAISNAYKSDKILIIEGSVGVTFDTLLIPVYRQRGFRDVSKTQNIAKISIVDTGEIWLDWGADNITGKISQGSNVTITGTGTDSDPYIINATGGGGSGDVVGPASSVADMIATFDGTTGKLIKDSSVLVSSLAPLASPTLSSPTVSTATASTPAFFSATKELISATGALLGTFWHNLTAKSTPVDADEITVLDSAASFEAKRTTLTQLWSNFIRPKIESIVIFYEDFTSYSGANYTFNGTGLSGSGSGFALNNATSSFSNYVIRNQKTQLLNYRDWIEFTISGNGNGIQVGVYNGTNGLFLKLDCNAAGNRGQATIITLASGVSTVLGTSASNLTYTNGDVIRIELIRDDFNFRGIVTNVTTSSQTVVAANFLVGDINFSTFVGPASTLRNSNPCIMLLQGTMLVTKWKYEVPTTQVEMIMAGDSITFGGNVTAFYKSYSRLVTRNLTKDRSLVLAYPQATSTDLVAIVPEILTIKPRYCSIMIGANDASASVAQATYNANIVSICNQLIAGGIIPIILTPLPMTSGTPNGFITSYTAGINAMAGQYFVINTNATPNISTNLADGIHPTDLGHELVYRTVEADMVKYRLYSNTLPFNRSHLVDGTLVDKLSNQSAVANATAGVIYSSSDTDLTKQVYNNNASTTTAYKKKVVEKTTGEGFIFETPSLTNGSRALDVISGGDVNTSKIPFQFHTYHDGSQTALVMRENAATPLGFQSFSMLMQGAVLGEILTYGNAYSDAPIRLDMGIRAINNLRLIASLGKKISFIFSNIGNSSGEVAQFTPNKNLLLGVTAEPTSAGTTISLANGVLATANNTGSGVSMTSISGVLNIRNHGGDVIVLGSNSGWTALTGTADKTAYATYSGTANAIYVQAELQGVMDAVKKVTEHQKAIVDALLATGLLKA